VHVAIGRYDMDAHLGSEDDTYGIKDGVKNVHGAALSAPRTHQCVRPPSGQFRNDDWIRTP